MPLLSIAATVVTQQNPKIKIELLAQNLNVPWGMTLLSDDLLLFSERDGRLATLNLTDLSIQEITGLPAIAAAGQGGLMDVTIGPNFKADGWIYFTYSKPFKREAATTLARAKLDNLQLTDWQDLLVTTPSVDSGQHFGSRIAFDDKGHVFFSNGDRGERKQAQDLSNHLGTIMRLRLDGSTPKDNPFIDEASAKPEIWSFGHRNPQGLLFDNQNKRLWSIEHGPRGGDEINLIKKGLNYGWPVVSHGKEYWGPFAVGEGLEKAGMQPATKVYIPSIAPASLLLYRGEAFPDWQGNLFAGALKLRHLNRIGLSGSGKSIDEERLLQDLNERIRAILETAQGWIIFSTDSGKIFLMRPAKN